MSVQFGTWNSDGRPVEPSYLERAGKLLVPYGPDAHGAYIKDSVGILYRAFHTTRESRRETQPYITPSGPVLTWDGRLDNRAELTGQLEAGLAPDSTDVAIVAAAYEEWGTGSFRRLIGDWALSVWNPISRSLILAKDPIGTRHLYYSFVQHEVSWSTILDPLVLLGEKSFELEEEYIAGWLSFFPATHLTPYVGIHAVPPSCFIRLEPGKRSVTKYWDFDPGHRIRYRTDREYEEHFRQIFAESVRCRLRSDSPVLAELSGGMDSSSIVCMADHILSRESTETPRVDTISYYNDSEPNWNERPYFTKVEEKRGRIGCHIDVGAHETILSDLESDRFTATPASGGRPNKAAKEFAACLASQGNRAVLSGIGGDEVTGGVPTALPELMDLLGEFRLKALARQLKFWALNKRKPWFHLLFEAMSGFFPAALAGTPKQRRPAPWLQPGFVTRQRPALTGYPSRVKLSGALPSFQENLRTVEAMRRQLGCAALPREPIQERRYPYLDRGLLEFLCAIPREQLVRPGHRRSLMRRALLGIVPEEILNRKRKAFVVRGPMTAISTEWAGLTEMSARSGNIVGEIIDQNAFSEAIRGIRNGREVHMIAMVRMLGFESWLSAARDRGLLSNASSRNALRLTVQGDAGASSESLPGKGPPRWEAVPGSATTERR